jgi:hypothetical protein
VAGFLVCFGSISWCDGGSGQDGSRRMAEIQVVEVPGPLTPALHTPYEIRSNNPTTSTFPKPQKKDLSPFSTRVQLRSSIYLRLYLLADLLFLSVQKGFHSDWLGGGGCMTCGCGPPRSCHHLPRCGFQHHGWRGLGLPKLQTPSTST